MSRRIPQVDANCFEKVECAKCWQEGIAGYFIQDSEDFGRYFCSESCMMEWQTERESREQG